MIHIALLSKSLPQTVVNTEYLSYCVNITHHFLNTALSQLQLAKAHHQQCQGHWYQLDIGWQHAHRLDVFTARLSYIEAGQ